MDTLLLYHHTNNTLNTLCRLCLDQSGTTDIFIDCSLPDKIYSITGIKVDNVNPYPNKLCDNCCGIIQLTLEFRESIINNDKHLHDFVKVYFPSQTVPTSNRPVSLDFNYIPEERRTAEEVICNTVSQESSNCSVQPLIRVRNDLFEIVNTDSRQTDTNANVSSLEKENGTTNSELQNCDTFNTDASERTTAEANNTCLIEDLQFNSAQQRSTNLTLDRLENHSCEDATANENDSDMNLAQDLKKDRQTGRYSYDENWEIVIFCENLEEGSENISKINNCNKHKHIAASHLEIKEDLLEHKDVKLANRIKFEDDLEYKCDHCSKFFTTPKKLYCHKRIHNKKYICAECNKAFATKGDLQKHIRTHTKEKPYKCDKCEKKFNQRILLRYHKNTIHNIKVTKTDEESTAKT